MSWFNKIFCSKPSIPFNYEHQLLADQSHMWSWPYDEATNPQQQELTGQTTLGNGALPRRAKGVSSLIRTYASSENQGRGYATLYECFQRGLARKPENHCLGTRLYVPAIAASADGQQKAVGATRGAFVWESYAQVDARAKLIGTGLVRLGLAAGSNVGIYSFNRAEWTLTAIAAYTQSMTVVALYSTLGEAAIEYIFEHAELELVCVSPDNLEHVLSVAPKLPKLKIIVQYDEYALYGNKCDALKPEHVARAKELGLRLIGLSELEALAADASLPAVFPNYATPQDKCMIMYTSGTTGPPKGVLLSHGNVVAAIATVPYIVQLTCDDSHLSYLPLAHVMEMIIQMAMLANGASIGFFQNNIRKLTEDLICLQPTFLAGVPRVFTRIFQSANHAIAQRNFVVRYVINRAFAQQGTNLRLGKPRNVKHDKKIFSVLAQKVGLNRVKFVLTGAAPCPAYLLEFLQIITGATCLQGYGMSESSGAIAVMMPGDLNKGHVGAPIPCCQVKLVSCPELNYTTDDIDTTTGLPAPRGEICCQGGNVFAGYHKNEANTQETIIDGWLHTGDVGKWNPNGTLSVIDRKKNLFKLSQGEYIAVERVEATYGKSPAVSQLFVYGNSFKSFLVAVLVPNTDFVTETAKHLGAWTTNGTDPKVGEQAFCDAYHQALTGPHADAMKQAIRASLKEQERQLKGFEKIVDFHIESRVNLMGLGFTEENECITPTFKLKRNYLLKRYIVELKQLYSRHGEPNAANEKWPGEA